MELRKYFEDIKRWALIIIASVICSMLIVGVISYFFLDNVFETSSTIAITNQWVNQENNNEAYLNVSPDRSMVQVFGILVESDKVIKQTIVDLKLEQDIDDLRSTIKVEVVEDTGIIKISVENKMPQLAKDIANSLVTNLQAESKRANLAGKIYVIDAARLPVSPARPNISLNMLIAALGGAMAGVLVVLILEYIDNTIKNINELQEATGTIVLGTIPQLRNKKRFIGASIIELQDSIKILRTKLLNICKETSLKVILVTSPDISEGKSFVAANLAASIGILEVKVLLMDCNLRKPSLWSTLNLDKKETYNFLATNKFKFDIYNLPGTNLDVIASDSKSENSSELLESPEMAALINSMKENYDIVIVDGPAVMTGADATILSKLADGVVTVVSYRQSEYRTTVRALDSLKSVGANIVGTAFNRIPAPKMFIV